jgi:hypothetical protein
LLRNFLGRKAQHYLQGPVEGLEELMAVKHFDFQQVRSSKEVNCFELHYFAGEEQFLLP